MKFTHSLARCAMVAVLACAGAAALAQEGVTRTSIVLGQSIALTGPGSALARAFHTGAKLYFDRVNAAGDAATGERKWPESADANVEGVQKRRRGAAETVDAC